jgi:hypothetical protein
MVQNHGVILSIILIFKHKQSRLIFSSRSPAAAEKKAIYTPKVIYGLFIYRVINPVSKSFFADSL